MAVNVVERYLIPGFGKAGIVHDTDPKPNRVNGEYWVQVDNYGVTGRYSKNAEEARRRTEKELLHHVLGKKTKLENELAVIHEITEAAASNEDDWLKKFEVQEDGEKKE